MAKIELFQGDITQLALDALVNAANQHLLGGGGVDGAMHRAAGPELLAACRKLKGCATGQAKITEGFKLKARFVIHTVGPVWQGGNQQEADLLVSCYQSSLNLSKSYHLSSIAFPAISCGVYGYPIAEACQIAYNTVQETLLLMPDMQKVIFCCFDQAVYDEYQSLWGES